MHFQRASERASRHLGQIVLKEGRSATSRATAFISVDSVVATRLIPGLPMELKLYSREWCSWCIDAKDYLSEKGYCFREIDVGKDRDAYEDMKKLSAQTYVPTFVAGDKVLANFDTDQLQQFLDQHQINP